MRRAVSPPDGNPDVSGPIPRADENGRENAAESLAVRAALARRRLAIARETQAPRLIFQLHERAAAARELLDPETQAAKREWEEAEYVRRETRAAERAAGSSHGARRQCQACKKFLGPAEWQCSSCGFAENAGYLGVPAKVSIYERWR